MKPVITSIKAGTERSMSRLSFSMPAKYDHEVFVKALSGDLTGVLAFFEPPQQQQQPVLPASRASDSSGSSSRSTPTRSISPGNNQEAANQQQVVQKQAPRNGTGTANHSNQLRCAMKSIMYSNSKVTIQK